MNKNGKEQTETGGREINPHAVVECIKILCSAAVINVEDIQEICLDAVLVAHHPFVLSVAKDLWIKIVKHLKLKPKDLIVQRREQFRKVLIEDYKLSPVSIKCLNKR